MKSTPKVPHMGILGWLGIVFRILSGHFQSNWHNSFFYCFSVFLRWFWLWSHDGSVAAADDMDDDEDGHDVMSGRVMERAFPSLSGTKHILHDDDDQWWWWSMMIRVVINTAMMKRRKKQFYFVTNWNNYLDLLIWED